MIWTTATGMVTQLVTRTTLTQESPQLGALVAEHGLLGGLRRRIEDWREYPPHGPVTISTRTGTQVDDARKERETAA
jgi:hypothetical protein